jgi:hypothetical protein
MRAGFLPLFIFTAQNEQLVDCITLENILQHRQREILPGEHAL